ncbi:MAG: non-canonical purine NTP pyrophosphatase, partial [Clostridia bacterium]|nr:non-canonical purine NTP pyrophosphatase [Clostridia bacterium]
MKILIASRNRAKIKELEVLLGAYVDGVKLELVSLDDVGFEGEIEETGTTFEENALIKARAGASFSGLITVADDSGLTVEALGGAPGVYSARYSGGGDEENNRKLLREL